jgi:guanylate kinase
VGVLLVVAGPSGAGKGTLVQKLRERTPELWLSLSATTREPRPGEVDGRDYVFLDRAEFERRRAANGFLESFDVFEDLYGTPRGPVEERLARGEDVILEIDVQGALAVRETFPDAVLVFIRPPSREEQRRRLQARGGDDPEEIELRLAAADAEEARAPEFDEVIVNEDIDTATDQLQEVLRRHRGR